MDLIQSYESEERFTETSTERELKPRQLRSVYLVTYSQADFKKFPSREIFAETDKRWMPVKQKMSQEHRVQLHFSSAHTNYYSTWKYTIKSDKSFI